MDRGDALWHVTLTVGGERMDPVFVHAALRRLASERPFMLGGRYGPDRAELYYWEEAPSRAEAGRMAHGVWREHRKTAALPAWEVVDVVVVSRAAYLRHLAVGATADATPSDGWQPY